MRKLERDGDPTPGVGAGAPRDHRLQQKQQELILGPGGGMSEAVREHLSRLSAWHAHTSSSFHVCLCVQSPSARRHQTLPCGVTCEVLEVGIPTYLCPADKCYTGQRLTHGGWVGGARPQTPETTGVGSCLCCAPCTGVPFPQSCTVVGEARTEGAASSVGVPLWSGPRHPLHCRYLQN